MKEYGFATANTHWVYTEAGYERSKQSKYLSEAELERRKPGMEVTGYYHNRCPIKWVQEGWVREA